MRKILGRARGLVSCDPSCPRTRRAFVAALLALPVGLGYLAVRRGAPRWRPPALDERDDTFFDLDRIEARQVDAACQVLERALRRRVAPHHPWRGLAGFQAVAEAIEAAAVDAWMRLPHAAPACPSAESFSRSPTTIDAVARGGMCSVVGTRLPDAVRLRSEAGQEPAADLDRIVDGVVRDFTALYHACRDVRGALLLSPPIVGYQCWGGITGNGEANLFLLVRACVPKET